MKVRKTLPCIQGVHSWTAKTTTVLILVLLLLLNACEAYPPELVTISHRLVVHQQAAEQAALETLSVFAIVRDKDGQEDVEAMYIVNDEQELFWKLDASNWTYKEEDGELWLGSNGLSASSWDQQRLPRGLYRLLLVDQAGQRSERSFMLSAPDFTEYTFPSIMISTSGTIELNSSYTVNTLFFFDAGQNVVKTSTLSNNSANLDSLWGDGQWRSRARYVAVYSLDIKSETGFFSWKTALP